MGPNNKLGALLEGYKANKVLYLKNKDLSSGNKNSKSD